MLAFTGLDVFLMNIDLDEYLVTTVPELQVRMGLLLKTASA